MDVIALTRALVDIESITDNEERVGEYLLGYLRELTVRTGGAVEKMEVAPHRFNVFAHWGEPTVTLSTHIDTKLLAPCMGLPPHRRIGMPCRMAEHRKGDDQRDHAGRHA